MKTWKDLSDTKWRDRTRLELFAHENGGQVEYRCGADGAWEVTATIPASRSTWIVSSGPQDSIEAACAEVVRRFGFAGQTIA